MPVDVYLPDQPTGASAIVVHGGGFIGGWRAMPAIRTLARGLTDAGIAVVAPDWRVLLRGGRFDEGVADAAACLAWWRRRAADLGLDPDRVALIGLSAGAAVAAAASPDAAIERLALFYGPHDFERLPLHPPLAARLLLRDRDPDTWRRRSPARTATHPAPTLLVHGDRDRLVPIAHSELMLRVRQEAGLPVSLSRYEGSGHGFLNWGDRPDSRRAVAELIAWLR